MTVEEIIKLCGGEHVIVNEFKLATIYKVQRWKTYGIPLNRWPGLMTLAKERGHKLTGRHLWDAVEDLITRPDNGDDGE